MKIIDRNGRLFGKISVIDVIVILVVAVMAVALYLKTNTMTHTSTATPDDVITYQVMAYGMPSYVGDHIQVGDKFFDEDNASGGCLGKVTAVEILPGEKLTTFADGTAGLAPVEDGINVLLTVQGTGLISGDSYALNRIYNLGVNSARNFCTEYVRMTGTVVSIG